MGRGGTNTLGFGAAAVMALLSSACSPKGYVRGRAAADLHCAKESIVVTGSVTDLRAEGCGQYALYRCGSTGPHNSGCWQKQEPRPLK